MNLFKIQNTNLFYHSPEEKRFIQEIQEKYLILYERIINYFSIEQKEYLIPNKILENPNSNINPLKNQDAFYQAIFCTIFYKEVEFIDKSISIFLSDSIKNAFGSQENFIQILKNMKEQLSIEESIFIYLDPCKNIRIKKILYKNGYSVHTEFLLYFIPSIELLYQLNIQNPYSTQIKFLNFFNWSFFQKQYQNAIQYFFISQDEAYHKVPA